MEAVRVTHLEKTEQRNLQFLQLLNLPLMALSLSLSSKEPEESLKMTSRIMSLKALQCLFILIRIKAKVFTVSYKAPHYGSSGLSAYFSSLCSLRSLSAVPSSFPLERATYSPPQAIAQTLSRILFSK